MPDNIPGLEMGTGDIASPLAEVEQTPQITKDQMDQELIPIIEETNTIAKDNSFNESVNGADFSSKVFENKETPKGLEKLHEIGILKGSNSWKEAYNEIVKVGNDAMKEVVLLQLLGGVGAVAVLEPTPLGEVAFGVTLGFVGKHSKIVQKLFKPEDVERMSSSAVKSGIQKKLNPVKVVS